MEADEEEADGKSDDEESANEDDELGQDSLIARSLSLPSSSSGVRAALSDGGIHPRSPGSVISPPGARSSLPKGLQTWPSPGSAKLNAPMYLSPAGLSVGIAARKKSVLFTATADDDEPPAPRSLFPSIVDEAEEQPESRRGSKIPPLDHTVVAEIVDVVKKEMNSWVQVCGDDRAAAMLATSEMRLSALCTGCEMLAMNPLDPATCRPCAVAIHNASEDGSPIGWVSDNFEAVTGHSASAALGKTDRFLLPACDEKNSASNAEELRRLQEFLEDGERALSAAPPAGGLARPALRTAKVASILRTRFLTLLRGQKPEGGPGCWYLLWKQHVRTRASAGSKTMRRFVVTLIFPVVSCVHWLDELSPWETMHRTQDVLPSLRERMQKEINEEVVGDPFQMLEQIDRLIGMWVLEVGKISRRAWIGEMYAPDVGIDAVEAFDGMLSPVLARAQKILGNGHPTLTKETVKVLVGDDADRADVAIAISDPRAVDCPIVCVTPAWERITGYSQSEVLGRNCRVLQPGGDTNLMVNGEELMRIRNFCHNPQSQVTMLCLMLNEKKNGRRFFNLLRMVHILAEGRPFLLSVMLELEAQPPALIWSRETSKAHEGALAPLLQKLKALIQKMGQYFSPQLASSSIQAGVNFATQRINAFLRSSPEDYEGDLYVPTIATFEANAFNGDREVQAAVGAIESAEEDLWGKPAPGGTQEVALCIADPALHDCPLLHISVGFESLTGYKRHIALGRNCRILMLKSEALNAHFNEGEQERVRRFEANADADQRLVSLLVCEDCTRRPFLCLVLSKHAEICGRDCVLTTLLNVTYAGPELPELLSGDPTAIMHLIRLRSMLRDHEAAFFTEDHWTELDSCLQRWREGLPSVLDLPRIDASCVQLAAAAAASTGSGSFASRAPVSVPVGFPLAGVELDESTSMDLIIDALKTGVRHFHLAFKDFDDNRDSKRNEMERRLLALKLSQKIAALCQRNFHFLRPALVFSLRTPPQLVSAFQEIQKSLQSAGYRIHHWLLDLRHATSESDKAHQAECFEMMLAARSAGEVEGVGLYGRSPGALLSFLNTLPAFTASGQARDRMDHEKAEAGLLQRQSSIIEVQRRKSVAFTVAGGESRRLAAAAANANAREGQDRQLARRATHIHFMDTTSIEGESGQASRPQGRRHAPFSGVTVCVIEAYPGKAREYADVHATQKMQEAGIALVAHNIAGPKNFWHHSEQVQKICQESSLTIDMLLLKWAEGQGLATIMPAVPTYLQGPAGEPGGDELHNLTMTAVWKGDGDVATGSLPFIHRKLTKAYYAAASVEECNGILKLDAPSHGNLAGAPVRGRKSISMAAGPRPTIVGGHAPGIEEIRKRYSDQMAVKRQSSGGGRFPLAHMHNSVHSSRSSVKLDDDGSSSDDSSSNKGEEDDKAAADASGATGYHSGRQNQPSQDLQDGLAALCIPGLPKRLGLLLGAKVPQPPLHHQSGHWKQCIGSPFSRQSSTCANTEPAKTAVREQPAREKENEPTATEEKTTLPPVRDDALEMVLRRKEARAPRHLYKAEAVGQTALPPPSSARGPGDKRSQSGPRYVTAQYLFRSEHASAATSPTTIANPWQENRLLRSRRRQGWAQGFVVDARQPDDRQAPATPR
eukprot:TRINITY_DN111736_c0_g1_i1.p1 TRINITY_DN111736_c0_g1~~TRINITY_DN111736_c0_g1_i1.p1  ORF type:complete len:1630 (-),score=342.23 TRINITY_DN111736_c0_g1_i1:75-4964(-)